LSENAMDWGQLDSVLTDCSMLLSRVASPEDGLSFQETASPQPSHYVKISNAYWAFYLRSKQNPSHSSNSQIVRCLRNSVEILKDRPQLDKGGAFIAVKLERLAEALKNAGRADESLKCQLDCFYSLVDSGTLRSIANLAATKPLKDIW